MGVLCELYQEEKKDIKIDYGKGVKLSTRYDGEICMLPAKVATWSGLADKLEQGVFADLNDIQKLTFEQIANHIEEALA